MCDHTKERRRRASLGVDECAMPPGRYKRAVHIVLANGTESGVKFQHMRLDSCNVVADSDPLSFKPGIRTGWRFVVSEHILYWTRSTLGVT
jgi:hypothetical protein